jgi:hypothetical protein
MCGAAACIGCYKRPPGYILEIPPTSRWTTVDAPGTGVSCLLPGPPLLDSRSEIDFDGTELRATLGRVAAGSEAVFGFVVLESPNGFIADAYTHARRLAEDDTRDEARRAGTKDARDDAHVRFARKGRRGGFSTYDTLSDRSDGISFRLRLLLGRTRVFGLYVHFPTASKAALEQTIDFYLDSARMDPSEQVIPTGDGRLALDAWRHVYPEGAGFAVSMPGDARASAGRERFGGGEVEVERYAVSGGDDRELFEVVVRSFERRPPEGAFDLLREQALGEGLGAREERFVHQRGFSGRAVIYESPAQVIRARYFVTERRLYEVRAASSIEQAARRAREHASFLDSFRILTQ